MSGEVIRLQQRKSNPQVVITPCEKYMPLRNEAIAEEMDKQVKKLFPSARGMQPTFHSVVKIGQSLYRCVSS
jgi:zeta-carotene desaturase